MRLARLFLLICGVILTPLYGMLTLLFLFGAVAGDCFPEVGHPCPTDHDRNMAALRVLIAAGIGFATLVYGGWKLDRWLATRDHPKDR